VRFHFQVRTPSHVMLSEVMDFADSGEARIEAARRIGVLLQTHAVALWTDQDWQMDVTNEEGLILFVIYVQAMKSPASKEW
jgi:hypothetical protein